MFAADFESVIYAVAKRELKILGLNATLLPGPLPGPSLLGWGAGPGAKEEVLETRLA